jgi:hypothetical protein
MAYYEVILNYLDFCFASLFSSFSMNTVLYNLPTITIHETKMQVALNPDIKAAVICLIISSNYKCINSYVAKKVGHWVHPTTEH